MALDSGIEQSASERLVLEYLKDREEADKRFEENKERYAKEWLEKNTRAFDNHNMLPLDTEKEQHAIYMAEQRAVIESAISETGNNLHNLSSSIESLGRQNAIDQYIEDQVAIIKRLNKEKQIAEERYAKARQDLQEIANQYAKNLKILKFANDEALSEKRKLNQIEPQYETAVKQISDYYRNPKNERMHDNISNNRHVRPGSNSKYGYAEAYEHAKATTQALLKRVESLSDQQSLESDPLIKERIKVQIILESADFRAQQNERISMLNGGLSIAENRAAEYNKQANAMALKAAELDLLLEERGQYVDFTGNEVVTKSLESHQKLASNGLRSAVRIVNVYKEQQLNVEMATDREKLAQEISEDSEIKYNLSSSDTHVVKKDLESKSEELSAEMEKLDQVKIKRNNEIAYSLTDTENEGYVISH